MKLKDLLILHGSILLICLLLNMTYGLLGWLGIVLITFIIGSDYRCEMDSIKRKGDE